MDTAAHAFLAQSRQLFLGEYLPKIARCVEELSPEDLWWRPNPVSNSAANLLLHLQGNVRQWIIHGVGGAPDARRRREEFAAQEGASGEALLERLRETLLEADHVLEWLDAQALAARRTIQGFRVTLLEAIYHVVEHFSTHVGQLIYITKLRTGRDLRFYASRADGTVQRSWPGASA